MKMIENVHFESNILLSLVELATQFQGNALVERNMVKSIPKLYYVSSPSNFRFISTDHFNRKITTCYLSFEKFTIHSLKISR